MLLTLFLLFQTSTTTCKPFLNEVVCETTQQPRVEWERLQSPSKPIVITPPPPQTPTTWYKREPETLAQQVGKLVSAGDCEGATKLALEGGDFDLVEKVKAYCGSKQD